ncbi:cupin domain-containing protein [uncultured Shewanella sp.]|uniref:cupin domain-containing protein n=1 Tax=uncultured Shewanella sp. TaxID=173975 RepID=UPI002631AA88|nr:cupin domain-containing protein [uncultured Shewanella sp.]
MAYFPVDKNCWQLMKGYKKSVLLKGDQDLLVEGTLIQLLMIEPYTSVAAHYHEQTLEVFHITSGAGNMVIDGELFQLKKGDTLTCEPKIVHSSENPYSEPFEYIVIKTHWSEGDSIWI